MINISINLDECINCYLPSSYYVLYRWSDDRFIGFTISAFCEKHHKLVVGYAHMIIIKELTREQCEKYRVML